MVEMTKPTFRFSPTGPAVALPALCLGLAVLAACVLLPAAGENRRLADERAALAADLDAARAQVAVNADFLARVGTDPELAERLALRQSNRPRPGTEAVAVSTDAARAGDRFALSPFALTAVPAPADPAPPTPGRWSALADSDTLRLWATGGGLFLLAYGLVMGAAAGKP